MTSPIHPGVGPRADAPARSRGSVSASAWINALSLDAPAVAVAWQGLFVIAYSNRWPRWPEAAALALAVWLIYAGDRLLDARRLDRSRPHLLRHRLHADHARSFAAAWCVGLCVAVGVTGRRLEPGLVVAGSVVAALVLLYGVGVHASGSRRRRVPKEWKVGLLFAAGVSVVAWEEAAGVSLLASTLLAGLLFAGNCLIVSRRAAAAESGPGRAAGGARALLLAAAAGSVLGVATGAVPVVLAAALLAGAASLLFLSRGAGSAASPLRAVAGLGLARVDPGSLLVDGALLIPPFVAALAAALLLKGAAAA